MTNQPHVSCLLSLSCIAFFYSLPVFSFVCCPRAFSPLSYQLTTQPKQLISVGAVAADGGDNRAENFDIESARSQLEHLIGTTTSSGRGDEAYAIADKRIAISIENPPQLTAISRLHRTTEIRLLSQLQESVDAADALNDLWLNERGSRAAARLRAADQVFQQGDSSWNNAEDMFLSLIEEYSPYWVEPLHRLGMLYYLQGRFQEARQLEELVLELKPWHIGSLSNIVRIAEAQKDVATALKWAERRLPSRLGLRRSRWVNQNVQHAMNMLSRGERRLRNFWGAQQDQDLAWQ